RADHVVPQRDRIARDVDQHLVARAAAAWQERDADAERIVELRVEDAEPGLPAGPERARHVGRRRHDVGVVDLRGERESGEGKEKRGEEAIAVHHDDVLSVSGRRRYCEGGAGVNRERNAVSRAISPSAARYTTSMNQISDRVKNVVQS